MVVLITGATSGFGYEFARYSLGLVARNEQRLLERTAYLTRAFLIEVMPLAKDFNPAAASEIYEAVSSKGLSIDVLINNAGQGEHTNFVQSDTDIDVIQLNVTSVVCLTKLFLCDMLAHNAGRILQVAVLAKYPTQYMSVYAATKAFLLSLGESINREVGDSNVTITTLVAGGSDTYFYHKAGAEETVAYREDDLARPQTVAKDAFCALMRGEKRIVSGTRNKLYAALSTILPDDKRSAMSPSRAPAGREHPSHVPSDDEREQINGTTGGPDGDFDIHKDHIHNKTKVI
ncbi:MAG TPA: SDR family NAD(P)-dependent oxidoreductase [Chryseosolibacter sp.]|nr:SDR family NAD(P)-dependent oxidoreductase [Chryseosolibacter sp.]